MQKSKKQACRTVGKWLAICEQLPEIRNLGELKALTTVYYPIAQLRMKLLEKCFEDFDAVELSILRFFSCGLTTAEAICKWMALPSIRYVQERLDLLSAEELIQNGRVSPPGEESLQIGQKVKLNDTEQVFQADAIAGLLLPREYQIQESRLIDREETWDRLPHLAHSESIALEMIQRAIEGEEKIKAYKRYRKIVLHVNVDQITDVSVADIKYVKAIMAWPMCSQVPLVFMPYYRRDRSLPGHHCDMPLFIPESLSPKLPQLAKETEVIPDEQLTSLADLYEMILAEQKKNDLASIAGWIKDNTIFPPLDITDSLGRIIVSLSLPQESIDLSPLELEILAAVGTGTLTPVETEMDFYGNNGTSYTKRISIWPRSAYRTDRVRALSKHWSRYGWELCKKAPISLEKAVTYIQNDQCKVGDKDDTH